ncbi:MAG: type II CAAX prenyl endopeptidase Rce1 family protein [Promethearchaeota archaeon]
MNKVKKYTLITIIFILLIIPLFFGVFIEYFIVCNLNLEVVLILIIGVLLLLILSKLIEICCYNDKNIEIMKNHDVVNAFINKDNQIIVWLFFPITMIFEELVFRYYLIGFLIILLELSPFQVILLSSLSFSLYHLHTWFSVKNLKLRLINLIIPFILGLFNGYLFLKLGLIPCIGIHYFIALFLYYNIYRRYFKKKY